MNKPIALYALRFLLANLDEDEREDIHPDGSIEEVEAEIQEEIDRLAGQVTYCDDCGDTLYDKRFVPVERLPHNITSANAGESAVLCPGCSVVL